MILQNLKIEVKVEKIVKLDEIVIEPYKKSYPFLLIEFVFHIL